MRKKLKAVIFDFDGTIANTLPFSLKKIGALAKKYRLDEKKLIEKIRTRSPWQLIKELNLSLVKLFLILFEVRKAQQELYSQIKTIKIFPGIKNLLKSLKNKEITLYIYSSNLKKNIDFFLKKEKIDCFFKKVYTGKSLLSKESDLTRILTEENLDREKVVYVADEVRDVVACRKAGIRMIGVGWGLAGKEGFENHPPDFFAEKPKKILSLIKSFLLIFILLSCIHI
ncbi:MAG: HAD-IA family hydrolase [Patescibacteria group bacterium]|nr:HAD-IA family hydrolase [Patescibacteria group bacterium]